MYLFRAQFFVYTAMAYIYRIILRSGVVARSTKQMWSEVALNVGFILISLFPQHIGTRMKKKRKSSSQVIENYFLAIALMTYGMRLN